MIQPGFMVLQSNRLENLRQLCVQWTSRYPLAPLENEVILVQSNGIAQWLRLALAADSNISDPMQSVAALRRPSTSACPAVFIGKLIAPCWVICRKPPRSTRIC